MTDAISALVTAFLITIIAVPATIKLATKFGLVDDPKLRPHPAHVHKTIIPRAGGLPIYLGIILAAAIFLPIEKHLIGIFLGITILLSLGLADDKLTTFNPYLRLFLLFLAAFCAVGSGIGVAFITNPLSHFNLPGLLSTNIIRLDQIIIPFNFLGDHSIVLIADIFAFFWIVTLTQVINWSKGVDGQMPGITLVAAITLGLFSLKLVSQGDSNQLGVATLSFITAGSALAFLIFNWYPAKILPGFSGSTILAFMLATLSILSGAKLATALLVLAIPSIDFIYTFLRRVLQGKSPVWGDRGHLHHKLLDLGWTPVQ
ncbi:MAG: MraY family glycosyltransferase, partial [Candidatus Daviesbacteria bacterium]|nr:MraY family glycosyltransferase [Candidatus Daviesbacteria bacterium]